MKQKVSFLFFVLFSFIGFSQPDSTRAVNPDSLTYLRFIDVVESSIFEHYKEVWGSEQAYHIIDSLGYEEDYKPTFLTQFTLPDLKRLIKKH
ncbi:MAG: hypothetical protein IPM74_13720 [Crocinitomicaceae bacterium]|nr:hypothetical protein [Crocinitomicaceae bacterium]